MLRALKLICINAISTAVVLGAAFLGLMVLDRSYGPPPGQSLSIELYPYEGFRNRADHTVTGDVPNEWQSYHDYNWQFGALGYFGDIDVRHPPAKQKDEIRIILTGGSGAMGQGARTNQDMLYVKLEDRLNELLKDSGTHARVINMAIGGGMIYQNFISLNLWAHALDPDIILAYAGRNDLWVPYATGDDGFVRFRELNELVTLHDKEAREDEPVLMRWMYRRLPNLYQKTELPIYLKQMFFSERYKAIADARYHQRRGLPAALACCGADRDDESVKALFGVAENSMALGLQSIKRDFQGIPIVLGWQAVGPSEWPAGGFQSSDYNSLYDKVVARTRGYVNDDWLFVNVHHELEQDPKPYIGTHLGNPGQTIVADMLADRMRPLVRRISRPATGIDPARRDRPLATFQGRRRTCEAPLHRHMRCERVLAGKNKGRQ
jgi:hypothetical protein